MTDLFTLFFNVIIPVFGIVLIGYLVGGRLQLQSQTLTRSAFYIFVPAFIFKSMSTTKMSLDHAAKMVCFIIIAHLLVVAVAACAGRLLRLSREMIAALVMVSVAGNIGNYGIAVIHFRFGEAALAPATLYYVTLSVFIISVCVGAAGWAKGGHGGIVSGIVKTPAIWAMLPAYVVAHFGVEVPVTLSRMIGLLADGMIPVMLFALGLQLLEQKSMQFTKEVFLGSALRLIAAPALACLTVMPFGLNHLESASGILQAGMPTAVLAAIIAKENDVAPRFVTTVVFVTTVASLISLPLLMLWL